MVRFGLTLFATLNRTILGHTNLTLKYHLDIIDRKKVLSTGTQTLYIKLHAVCTFTLHAGCCMGVGA